VSAGNTAGSTVADVGERGLIERIRVRVPPAPGWLRIGIGDDAAVVEPPRNHLEVITTDCAVEGVHFDCRFVPPDAIGHRALAVNLSDLAAMGATPRLATLSLVLPPSLEAAAFDALVEGLLALARAHGVALAGGNISRSPGPLVVDVMAIGTARPRKVLTRGGARPGDLVVVSGALGAGRAGLEMCAAAESGGDSGARSRYLRPEPRVRLGVLLGRTRAATACMDLSDGLADGLRQISQASGMGLQVDADALPIDEGARAWFEAHGRDPVREAVAGGDDYELLFTVGAKLQGRLRHVARLVGGLPLTPIGVVTRESGILLRRGGRDEELPPGFAHFDG
jgi:thiamine-monophosphate kinase